MPAYDNSIAVTSQTTEIISRLNIPYVSISLIPNIPHIHQLEIERVFTFDRDGSAETVNNFLKDKNVAIEDKRKLFLIPSNYITYNENTKTIDIDDLAVNQYDYVTTNPPYIIKVPPIVAGEDVIIRRKTISNTPLVIYSAGTKLTSNQLNLETTQLIYLIQEVLDRVYYQMLLNGDVVADVADNTVYTNALQESAVTTTKIADFSITNNKISTGEITYDKINTTTSPWAVDLYNDQAITGIKTLTHAIFSDSLKINYGVPEQQQGTQYVLAYNGDGNGGVEWQLNDPWKTVPSTIVQTGNNQTISGNKTFGGSTTTTFDGTVKFTQSPTAGKALVSSDSNGTASWQSVVNSIKLGGSNASTSTGEVVITPDSIGALSSSGGIVTGAVTFQDSVNLGDAIQDSVEIQGTFKIRPGQVNPTLGYMLQAGNNGVMSFVDPNSVLNYVKTINGKTGNTINLVASDLNALSTIETTQQSLAGPITFNGDVTLGNNTQNNINIEGTLKYLPGVVGTGQAGKVLTSTATGEVVWQDIPPTGLESLTLGSNATQNNVKNVTITAASINAVSTNTNESINGIKTFTNGLTISGGEFKYNVGSSLNGKVLTSDSSGNASWQTPPATGITSITLGGQSYSTSNVTITADSINAIAANTNSTITGDKTFTGSVTLGDSTDDLISISGQLKYTPNGVVPTNGLVLMSTSSGQAIWQTPDTTGFITPSTIGSYIPAISTYYADINNQLPKASTSQYGVVQLDQNGGLEIQNNKLRINPNYGTLPIATATQLGGIKIGSGLTINSTTGVVSVDGYTPGSTSVNSFNTRTGAVTPSDTDYTAVPGQSNSVIDAVDLSSSQNITGSKTFKAVQIVTSDTTSGVGGSGKKGIELNTSGLLKAQRATSTDKIFEGYADDGANTVWIKGNGNAFFNGLVEAEGGFKTNAGVTLGDTAADSLVLSGTVKIIPNKTTDYVLTCTNGNDGTAEWRPSPTAPVSSVNGLTGAVKIKTDNLYNAAGTAFVTPVTISENQTITANKQFDGTANFTNDVTIGNANTDILTINALPKIPLNAAVNKILVCTNADGSAGWQDKTIVSSVNGIAPVNGDVTLALSSLNGAATNASNTFSAAQTFTNNVIVTGNTTLGDSLSDKLVISSTLRIPTGAGLGKYLSCTQNTTGNEGTVGWSDLPLFVKTINSSTPDTNGNFNITASTLGVVDTTTAQNIAGNKTFTGSTTFDGNLTANGNITLGNTTGDIITIVGTLKGSGLGSVGNGKVLTSDSDGNIGLQNPIMQGVKGNNETSFRTGNVNLTAANIGAASTTDLNTTNANVTAAQTTANSALSAANTAQTTADGKLSSISTTTTTLGGNAVTTLDGNGTAANPLKVLRAEPAGPAGGDLAGNYPNPTIKDSSVTFAKMQNINTNRLLGRKDSSTGNIQEIQLGSGLQFNSSTGVLDCTVVGGSSLLGGGTFAIPQVWGGYNNFSNVTNFESTLNALGDLTVSGALSIEGNLAINSNKFNVNSSNGNTTVGGTLGVTGATTMGSVAASSLSLSTDLAIQHGGTGASDAANARTNLGLVIGTNVQAFNANLTQIAGLNKTNGNFIVGDGSNWVVESGSTARTSLGLGTIATQNSNNVSITGGSITNITDLAIDHGGTGASNAADARNNLGLNPVFTAEVQHTHATSYNRTIDVTALPLGVPTIYRQRTSANSGGQPVTANNYITFALAAGEAIQYEVFRFTQFTDAFPNKVENSNQNGVAFGSQSLQLGLAFSAQHYTYCWVMAIITRLS